MGENIQRGGGDGEVEGKDTSVIRSCRLRRSYECVVDEVSDLLLKRTSAFFLCVKPVDAFGAPKTSFRVGQNGYRGVGMNVVTRRILFVPDREAINGLTINLRRIAI